MKLEITNEWEDIEDIIEDWDDRMSPSKLGLIGQRIGNILKEAGRANLVTEGAIRDGVLRSGINFKVITSPGNLSISFGVPDSIKYAPVVEFGHTYTPQMIRAMFASFDRRKSERASKNILIGGRVEARPFIGPAMRDNRDRILGILTEAAGPNI